MCAFHARVPWSQACVFNPDVRSHWILVNFCFMSQLSSFDLPCRHFYIIDFPFQFCVPPSPPWEIPYYHSDVGLSTINSYTASMPYLSQHFPTEILFSCERENLRLTHVITITKFDWGKCTLSTPAYPWSQAKSRLVYWNTNYLIIAIKVSRLLHLISVFAITNHQSKFVK